MDVYGLLGDPVEHSLSPPMHNAGFAELGLDATYVTFSPTDVAAAIDGAQTLGIAGLNVTIPFKETVLDLVVPDDQASRIGAVNTIDLTQEPPTGHNTDIDGVQRAFEHHEVSLAGQRAVVIGAGGAARAVAHALVDAGATIELYNRTVSNAESLAAEVGAHAVGGLDDSTVTAAIGAADILVNATSVGMDSAESPVPPAAIHSELVVMDVVYQPRETRLLQTARQQGAQTIDGAWMLLFQGVSAFERWTGQAAPVDTMNAALRAQL